jgi:hypothetical protein
MTKYDEELLAQWNQDISSVLIFVRSAATSTTIYLNAYCW